MFITIALLIAGWFAFAGLICLTVCMASSRFNQEDPVKARRHREQVLWKLKVVDTRIAVPQEQ